MSYSLVREAYEGVTHPSTTCENPVNRLLRDRPDHYAAPGRGRLDSEALPPGRGGRPHRGDPPPRTAGDLTTDDDAVAVGRARDRPLALPGLRRRQQPRLHTA